MFYKHQAARTLKNIFENKWNKQALMCQCNESPTVKHLDITQFQCINKSIWNHLQQFSSLIWNLLPKFNLDTTSSAIILDESHKLNWVDLLTLCSTPSTSNFQQINAFYGRSGRGWLSKYILDAYLLAIVHIANFKANGGRIWLLRL